MKMYTTKEAAEFLGVSVRTIRRWLKSGKLVPEKKGDIGRGKCDIFSLDQFKNVTTRRRRRRYKKLEAR